MVTNSATSTQDQLLADFADVFDASSHGTLDHVQSIRLDANAPRPKAFPPRRVPVRLLDQVKSELNKMEATGVIQRVTKPTRYVLPVVFVRKANGALRICLDPRYINEHIQRVHFPLPKTEELFASLGGSRFFTVVDAHAAFWHLPIDPEASDLCTFATQWGNYQFKRLPFGIVDASERFCEVMHRLFAHLEGVLSLVDDFLIHGRTVQEHDINLRNFLLRCREVGLRLKPEKLQYKTNAVKFLGHTVSEQGISVLQSRVEAISAMPPPDGPEAVRRFLGVINYVMKFIPNASERTEPLRALAKLTPSEYKWTPDAQAAYDELKAALTAAPVLAHFDPNRPLVLSADASSYGLGAVLLQDGKPISYASATLTPTQGRYAQIEKELLAVLFACEHYKFYIIGTRVQIESDHRPLVAIVKKDIATLSPRLQRMMLRLLAFDFELQYVPGKQIPVPDALSRCPLGGNFAPPHIDGSGAAVFSCVAASPSRLQQLRLATAEDQSLQHVIRCITEGWPHHKTQAAPGARPFWAYQAELSYEDGLLYRGTRLVVPREQQSVVIEALHGAHQGVEHMLRQARTTVFWPGMTATLQQFIDNCNACSCRARLNPKEPLLPTPPPPSPWHTIGLDFIHLDGLTYLFAADYFTKDFLIKKMTSTTASAVCATLDNWWLQHGLPTCIRSDNGPPFASAEFTSYCGERGIVHSTISPGHSQSNGFVERMIQTVKQVISKAKECGQSIPMALLTLRTTPGTDGLVPATLAQGRTLRTLVPISEAKLADPPLPRWDVRRETLQRAGEVAKGYYDRTTRCLPIMAVGDRVLVRLAPRLWRRGVVCGIEGRSYRVTMENQQLLRRNRRFIRLDRSHRQNTDESVSVGEQERVCPVTGVITSQDPTGNLVQPTDLPANPQHEATQRPGQASGPAGLLSRHGRQLKSTRRPEDFVYD